MREKTLAFSLFPGNPNEQTSLKPLEQKVLGEFGCRKFIYCSDAEPGSEDIRVYNHMGKPVFTVTRPVKKLKKEWALYQKTIREKQVERVQKMPESGSTKRTVKIQMIPPVLQRLPLPQKMGKLRISTTI